mmetsp:Transcript_11810/g.27133  ORF Transcript_11810/g.27133 Transcript_11810/m.27133 type:complete len:299 (-) Transcript_11810:1766-2662(-)
MPTSWTGCRSTATQPQWTTLPAPETACPGCRTRSTRRPPAGSAPQCPSGLSRAQSWGERKARQSGPAWPAPPGQAFPASSFAASYAFGVCAAQGWTPAGRRPPPRPSILVLWRALPARPRALRGLPVGSASARPGAQPAAAAATLPTPERARLRPPTLAPPPPPALLSAAPPFPVPGARALLALPRPVTATRPPPPPWPAARVLFAPPPAQASPALAAPALLPPRLGAFPPAPSRPPSPSPSLPSPASLALLSRAGAVLARPAVVLPPPSDAATFPSPSPLALFGPSPSLRVPSPASQ